MKKIILISTALLTFVLCGALSLTSVSRIDGNALHTIQNAWVIVETENSGDSQANAWADTERTRKLTEALIVANAANETNISTFRIPPGWNTMQFRAIGITDNGTATHLIYLGTLGGGQDCSLTLAGTFDWVIGPQQSVYDQITFTLGGADGAAYVPQPGDTVTGNDSDETAVIVSIAESASTWSAGTAAGTVTYRSATGTFTGSETVTIKRGNKVLASAAYAHAATDLIDFELADTLVVTAAAWGSSWSVISPADDDTVAEAEIDVKGSDYMQIITTATNADTKLIITGH